VFIDGKWRIFEPTIPYMQQDPFAYIRNEDRTTRKQLEAIFGSDENSKSKNDTKWYVNALAFLSRWWKTAAVCAASLALIIVAGIQLGLRNTKERRLKAKARALVKRYGRKGIRGPEKTGWIAWANAVTEISEDESIAEIAMDMIHLAFAEGKKITRAIRPGEGKPRRGT
jgi:hypothetical protein